MIRKLRFKFVVINMAMIFAICLAVFATAVAVTEDSITAESIRTVERIANAPDLPDNQQDNLRRAILVIKLDTDGNIIECSGSLLDTPSEKRTKEEVIEHIDEYVDSGMTEEHDLRYVRRHTEEGDIVVFADAIIEKQTLNYLKRTWIFIVLVALAAFFLVSLFLSRWSVKPVEAAWKQQRQFVADASHELKTPLTVITTNAELLTSGECTEEDKAKFASSILTMSRQMRGLVEQLLELARVDNSFEHTDFAPLCLSDLVADSVLPFEPVFFERGLTLNCDIESNIRMDGNRDHLRQTVEILLDNAQKYSSGGGKTLLSLKKTRLGRCILTVANEGDPISDEDLEHIFKRFYRSDKVRRADGSYGLGLSIAQAVAAEHGGRIWAESKNGVNSFYLDLPMKEII